MLRGFRFRSGGGTVLAGAQRDRFRPSFRPRDNERRELSWLSNTAPTTTFNHALPVIYDGGPCSALRIEVLVVIKLGLVAHRRGTRRHLKNSTGHEANTRGSRE